MLSSKTLFLVYILNSLLSEVAFGKLDLEVTMAAVEISSEVKTLLILLLWPEFIKCVLHFLNAFIVSSKLKRLLSPSVTTLWRPKSLVACLQTSQNASFI